MFLKRATLAFLVVAIGLAAAGRAAAADVLDAIPNTALAVVLVNRLEATIDKIEKLAVKVQAPSASLLPLTRLHTGINEGLDDKATAAIAWLPSEEHSLESPIPIVILPVTDYAKFVAQFKPENAKGKITQVNVTGKPMLVCQRGGFAVLTGVEYETALKDVLASTKSVGEDLSPLRTWLAEVDVAAVAMPSTIKIFSGLAAKKLSMVEQPGLPGEPNEAAMRPAGRIFQQVLSAAGDELQLAAIGIRADEAGTVRVTTRQRLTPGGEWAAAADRVEAPGKSLLTGLPEGPFALVDAIQFSEPFRHLMAWGVSEQGRKLNPALAKLSAEQQARLVDVVGRMAAQQQNAKFWLGATKPDEPLYGNAVGISKVEDTKKYFALFEEFNQLQFGANKDGRPIAMSEIHHIRVHGHEALEVIGNMKQMAGLQPALLAAPLKAAMIKIFGSDDQVRTYMAAIDEHTVVSAFISVDNLQRAIAAVERNGGSGGGLDPPAAEIAARLPTDAQGVALVNLSAVTEFAQSMAASVLGAKGPVFEFPASPPIGLALKVSSAGVQGETVISGATLEAIGQFVANLRDKPHAAD